MLSKKWKRLRVRFCPESATICFQLFAWIIRNFIRRFFYNYLQYRGLLAIPDVRNFAHVEEKGIEIVNFKESAKLYLVSSKNILRALFMFPCIACFAFFMFACRPTLYMYIPFHLIRSRKRKDRSSNLELK